MGFMYSWGNIKRGNINVSVAKLSVYMYIHTRYNYINNVQHRQLQSSPFLFLDFCAFRSVFLTFSRSFFAPKSAVITVVIGKIIHGSLYLRGRTIQEVGGKTMMGRSIHGVAVIDGSLYSRVYGMHTNTTRRHNTYVMR